MSAATEALPVTAESLEEAAGFSAPVAVDYYDSSSGKYLVRHARGQWLAHDTYSYKRILRSRGIREGGAKGSALDECDLAILDVQDHRAVSYHGALCGRNSGMITEHGRRILVTEDMVLPEPRQGEWETLMGFLKCLFWHGETQVIGDLQMATFFGWMQSSVRALREGRLQQQQALAICGRADCGKSLLQHLITKMLGGRSAKAERYFSGRTEFNADVFAAEHLILEDNYASTKIGDRLKLGASLKEHCVGTASASLHAKGRNAINLRPWWRVSITLNDDPEAMMILPPLDDQMADKLILLRASRYQFPMPVGTLEEKHAFHEQLVAEIPAFLHYLLHEYELHKAASDPRRYHVKTFHHPELKESLESLSPEMALLDLMDAAFRGRYGRKERLELTAVDIEAMLKEYDGRSTDRLLRFRTACGAYLGRLAKQKPERVSTRRASGARLWLISPPGKSEK